MAQVIEPAAGTDLGGLFEVVVKVRSDDTNGVLAAIEQTVPPRKLIPPHTHENDVWVYVLTGEIGILVGDEVEHDSERQERDVEPPDGVRDHARRCREERCERVDRSVHGCSAVL